MEIYGFCQPFFYLSPCLYSSPHSSIDLMMGRMDSPSFDKAYSTRGGTSGKTVRVMMPSASIERRLSVSTFWLMPSRFLWSSLNRQGLARRLRMVSSFHLLPIRLTVVATGHSGSSAFVFTIDTSYALCEGCYIQI